MGFSRGKRLAVLVAMGTTLVLGAGAYAFRGRIAVRAIGVHRPGSLPHGEGAPPARRDPRGDRRVREARAGAAGCSPSATRLSLRIYRVDLPVLFATDLRDLSQVKLTGIDPLRAWEEKLAGDPTPRRQSGSPSPAPLCD